MNQTQDEPRRVLVIDDEPGVRWAFSLALEDLTIEVIAADNGADGLAAAQRDRPDVIFLDLHMPGMNGIETLRRIRSLCPEASVFVMTGYAESYMEPLVAAAADELEFELFRKPLRIENIYTLTTAVLAASQAARSNCALPC